MKEFELYRKNINVLYVEDDDITREKLSKFLSRIFKKFEQAINGADALIKFHENKAKNNSFDLIISDINMPMMDGITMLEKIREVDSDVTVIFITARTETENLLKAINLHVEDYITKPLDLEVIDKKLQKITKDLFYRANYENQKKELENYTNIINQEAIVSKIDKNGLLTFVNEAFCNISLYSEEELLNKPYSVTIHPSVSELKIKEIWAILQKGEIWSGTNKNISKNNDEYFTKTKIFPVFENDNKNIKEYVCFQFINTDEEHTKRELNKNLLHQITTYKLTIGKMKKQLDQYENEKSNYLKNINSYENRIQEITEKKLGLLKQLESYEQNNLESSKMDLMMKKDKSKQFEIVYESLTKSKSLNLKLEKKLKELSEGESRNNFALESYREKEIEFIKRIKNLKDLVSNLEKENEKLKLNESNKSILSFGKK